MVQGTMLITVKEMFVIERRNSRRQMTQFSQVVAPTTTHLLDHPNINETIDKCRSLKVQFFSVVVRTRMQNQKTGLLENLHQLELKRTDMCPS